MRKREADALLIRTVAIALYDSMEWRGKPEKGKNSGAHGDSFELQNTMNGSCKKKVSKPGHNDNYFMLRDEITGKITKMPIECKTSGGRVGNLIKMVESGKDGYVTYELDVMNSNTDYLRRYVPKVIMKTSVFVNFLIDCHVLKNIGHDGKIEDLAIQCSNKPFFLRLSEYPLAYDQNKVYTESDFDGLIP